MVLSLLATLALVPDPTIHPFFLKTPEAIRQAWDKGRADAETSKNSNAYVERMRKGLRREGTLLGRRYVDFVYLWTPRSVAYTGGFDARKELVDDETTKEWLARIVGEAGTSPRRVAVSGYVTDYAHVSGSTYTPADAGRVNDVRVAMKVGDRVYPAESQPGEAQVYESGASAYVLRPALGEGDQAIVYGEPLTATKIFRNILDVTQSALPWEGRVWYVNRFYCTIALYDEDGAPRVRPTDKGFQIVVRYGDSEQKVDYDLDELERKGL